MNRLRLTPSSLADFALPDETEPAVRARIADRYRTLAQTYRAAGEGVSCGALRDMNLNLAAEYEARAAQVQP